MSNEVSAVDNRSSSSQRLTAFLGWFRFLLNPFAAPLLGLTGWVSTAPFSNSAGAMGLCWWGVTLLLWSIQAEQKWLNILPFPPLTVIALHLFLRWELGGMLLLLSDENSGAESVWVKNIAEALPINAIFTTMLIGIPLLLNSQLLRHQSIPRAVFDGNFKNISSYKKWILLTSITGIVAIGYSFVGYFGGTLDRGPEYLRWAGKFWRPDTLFSATIRLRDIYFLILPWTVYILRRKPLFCLAFIVPTSLSLYLTSLLGGRGIIIYPLILIMGGFWLAGAQARVMRTMLIATITFSLAFIPLSTTFRGASVNKLDLAGRYRLLLSSNPFLNYSFRSLGREIYASSDPYLFESPGIDQKPAGFKRFSNLKYLWLPRIFGENRPEINDGHLVAYEIQGTLERNKEDGRYISFESITTGGDLYWRFRWSGVLIGGALMGTFYAIVCRLWYNFADLSRGLHSLLIALFPTTFLQGPPLRSVLETAWNWLYELPKYAFIVTAIILIINAIIRVTSRNRSQTL